MPPNLDSIIGEKEGNSQITILLTPISSTSSTSTSEINDADLGNDSITSDDDDSIQDLIAYPEEHNFKKFLVQVTDTEDLSSITQLKLRVISREVALQYLNVYTPALRELILDGSVVSSLRDIGGGLKNLRILRVNRCGLTSVDGGFSIENLEELYATDNEITSLLPCAFLSNLKVLDVRRNKITIDNCNYLNHCENIEKLYLDGNPGISASALLKQSLHQKLPKLKILNGLSLSVLDNEGELLQESENETSKRRRNKNRNISNPQERLNFSVDFPPRMVLQRYFHT